MAEENYVIGGSRLAGLWNRRVPPMMCAVFGMAGRILDGRTYDAMPSRVSNPVPSTKEWMAMIEQVKVRT